MLPKYYNLDAYCNGCDRWVSVTLANKNEINKNADKWSCPHCNRMLIKAYFAD